MPTAEIVKPDIIALVSGDKDFIPVILELRRRHSRGGRGLSGQQRRRR